MRDTALGVVGDVVSDSHGRVYVLDVVQKSIMVQAGSGRTTRLGRPGRGPGEFVAPVSLAVDGDGRVMVLDPGTLRIERYTATASGVERTRALPLAFPAEDFAACGGRLYLLGSWNGYLLHEAAPSDGRILRSFAPSPVGPDDLMAGYHASGYLECGPEEALTFLPLVRPEIVRYSATTGALLGRMQIPGYQRVQVTRHGAGVMYRAPESGSHDVASSLFTLPGGRQVVQIGALQRGARTNHEFGAVRSFVVSWNPRSIRPLARPLPRIVRAVADSGFVVQTDPSPHVSIAPIPTLEEETR